MDLFRTIQLAGLIQESNDAISEIKGYGSNWFYLVTDVHNKNAVRKNDVTFADLIAKVKLGSLINIANANSGDPFDKRNPQLYPESDKEKALADAKARYEKLLDK